MSLHTLAHHMSTHGRGPDSTLVHMSPREVQGLQAIAMRHGGSLTINPQTGLPEAGILENLLPAIAGFALNAFAPGVGGAVGSALGLTGGMASAVGTGLIVGGVTGLASGSLEKGLLAGLGGYGGAGLGGALVGAGSPSVGMDAASGARDAGISAAAEASPAATFARLQAGANTVMSAPADALKNNALNIGLASAPVFMDSFGGDDEEETSAPKRQSGNRYMYRDDPITGRSYAYKTYSGDEVKDSPPVVFGNAGGGLMQHYDAGGPVEFGNVGAPVDANGNPITPATEKTISDSQRAQDYLLGKPGAVNPFLFYHKAPAIEELAAKAKAAADAAAKAKAAADAAADAKAKAGISALTPEFIPHGGSKLSAEQQAERDDPNSWINQSPEAHAQYYANNPRMSKFAQLVDTVLSITPVGQLQQRNMPDFVKQKLLEHQGISPRSGFSYITPPSYFKEGTNTPVTPSSPAVRYNVNQPGLFDGMDRSYWNAQAAGAEQQAVNAVAAQAQQDAADRAALQGEKQAAVERAASSERGDNGYTGGYQGSGQFSGMPSSFGGVGASPYANGGGITALAQGGMYNLGSYSDGGRLLRGPGDGVSDDIPATIGRNQPARLADGEFVVPARIVSELGNGSTEAGARKLYAMMDRVQKARSKTVGKNKVAANSRADKYLPV